MWTNFYTNGGWGMHPISVFGFLLMVASVLYVLRPESRRGKLVALLGGVTLMAGLLGTSVGICNSAHYLPQVAAAKQLEILALGCEESLHNLVFALLIVVIASIVAAAGLLRSKPGNNKGLTSGAA